MKIQKQSKKTKKMMRKRKREMKNFKSVNFKDLLSGSDIERFCDERIRKSPNPESGRKPANKRRRTPGS